MDFQKADISSYDEKNSHFGKLDIATDLQGTITNYFKGIKEKCV